MNGHSENNPSTFEHALKNWTSLISKNYDLGALLEQLEDVLLNSKTPVYPKKGLIFKAFEELPPEKVKVVLLGEDPYPRPESARGVAFWDGELQSWDAKGRGNCMHNMFKAILVYKGFANYTTKMDGCREINRKHRIVAEPENLFRSWIEQGVLLLNASLTFPAHSPEDKKRHHGLWAPFCRHVLKTLKAESNPFFIGWGKKAQNLITTAIEAPFRHQFAGHPTYIHQFLNPKKPNYTPFKQLAEETDINWSGLP